MSTLTAKLGRDDRFDFQAYNANGSPRNISACSVLFGVKLTPDAALIIGAGLGAGVIFTDPAVGKFAVLLPPIAKIGLSSLTSYYWDVLVVEANGQATTPLDSAGEDIAGMLEVEESVTPVSLDSTMQPPANFGFHPEITAILGGGSSALNGYDTTLLSRPCIFVLRINGQRQEWLARAKTADDVADDTEAVLEANLTKVLPLNFDSVANNTIWERIS